MSSDDAAIRDMTDRIVTPLVAMHDELVAENARLRGIVQAVEALCDRQARRLVSAVSVNDIRAALAAVPSTGEQDR